MTEGRILGLDVGDVRIGVALSDPLGMFASPHSVITRGSIEADLEAVAGLVRDHEVVRVVVGMPLDRQGTVGMQGQKVMAFINALRGQTDAEIDTVDERFTTAQAERTLVSANMRRKDRKQVVDKVAAQHILQLYLDRGLHRSPVRG